jgi:tetratricopeptide (TPR) repeat protein
MRITMKHVRGLTVLATAVLLFSFSSGPAMAKDSKPDQSSKQAEYPAATRTEPTLDLRSVEDQKNLKNGLDAVAVGDPEKARQVLQPLVDGSKSKYAQALALQGLATLKYKSNDLKGAIALLQRSLEIGVIPNDTYFQLEYELAQFQVADEQYQPALDTVAKWRAEGKKETAASYALEGNALYRLEKYPQAIVAIKKAQSMGGKQESSWNQILMASYAETGQNDQAAALAQQQMASNPDDPNALSNAAAVLMQAHKYPEAIQMMEKARSGGTLNSESAYINLAKLYLITGQETSDPAPNANKASQVLEEGISKGVLKPSADSYVLLAQAAEMSNHSSAAMDAYNKAIPLAKDGDPALRAGRLLLSENKNSQAKVMIQQALDKGVKSKGKAYMLLAEAERGLKNKPAAITAMKKAALEPDTAAKAKAWLKHAGAG